MHPRAVAVGLLSLVLSGGCTPGEDTPTPDTVRSDSAGVEIVVNSATAARAPVFAEPQLLPEVRLGSLDASPDEQFGSITDLVAVPDGGVAVLDEQAAQVRYFGPEGDFIRSYGAPGDGPGEFQDPIELALLPGDTLAIFDAESHRVTRFHLSGALGRVTRLEETRARVVAASFRSNGTLVTQSRWISATDRPLPGPEPTFLRDTVALLTFDAQGVLEDTIDVVPGPEIIASIQIDARGMNVIRRMAAFGRSNVFAAHPDGVWSGANDRFEIRLVDPANGRVVRIVRSPGLEVPVSDRTADLVHDRAMSEAETPEDRRWAESWYAVSPRPATQPAYDLLEVDPHGRTWLREWTPDDAAPRWWVFEPGGGLLGSVSLPPRTTALAVGCNVVWTVERDELDVSYVSRYALPGQDPC